MNVVKKRELPVELRQLESLLRRLNPRHLLYETIEGDYKAIRSGVRGEREVEFPLQFLNKQEYFIQHNLRLEDENGYFQVDPYYYIEVSSFCWK